MSLEQPRPLDEIVKEMEGLVQVEESHGWADDLLLEAIKRIASLGSLASQREKLDRLIEAWQKLPKWYE